MSQTLTFKPDADPELVAKVQLRVAALKPACSQCGKNLPAKALKVGHRCLDRDACRVRSIFRTPTKVLPGAPNYRWR